MEKIRKQLFLVVIIWSCWQEKIVETFILVCEALYGPIRELHMDPSFLFSLWYSSGLSHIL